MGQEEISEPQHICSPGHVLPARYEQSPCATKWLPCPGSPRNPAVKDVDGHALQVPGILQGED